MSTISRRCSQALDIHAAVFVGCSMGGGLAVDFALRHPGRVIGLVLIGTSVTGAPWSATDAEQMIEAAEEDACERGDLRHAQPGAGA